MTHTIDSVMVNGSKYRISSGEVPFAAYEVAESGEASPTFLHYSPSDDEVLSSIPTSPDFFVHRTGTSGNYGYRIVATVSASASDFDGESIVDRQLGLGKLIDGVVVNGLEYLFSPGGTLPISVYAGTTTCGSPSFSNREFDETDMFYPADIRPFLRRTQTGVGDCGPEYDYDIVFLADE